jgi:regulator of replication initiation timing
MNENERREEEMLREIRRLRRVVRKLDEENEALIAENNALKKQVLPQAVAEALETLTRWYTPPESESA